MPEVVLIVRRPELPGVDLVQARETPRTWGHLNGSYAFGTMYDWNGRLGYRRRRMDLRTGDMFLCDPGETFQAEPTDSRPGTFRVIEIAPEKLEAACRAEGMRGAIHFASAVTRASAALASALDALQGVLERGAEPLEEESYTARLAHAALASVLEPGGRAAKQGEPLGHCARLREILRSTESTRLNLSEFALQAGVSQFQLLRAFKRHYGFPPHAYALHVRVDRARQLLRRGFSVAEAAAASDFTDQSHFTRHFRRIWGMTPGQYASGAGVRTNG